MNKVYQYRNHIRWGQYVLLILPLMTTVACGFIGISSFQLWRTVNPSSALPIGLFLVMGSVGLVTTVGGFLIWYLYYRMAGVRVIIENDALVYKYRGGEKRISFDQITKISLPSIPYLGGWITIIGGQDKIRLTVVLNEIGDFVQTLKTSLNRNGLANRYDESKLFLFLKTAVFSDQSWERVYSLFWKLILATLGMGLLGYGIAKISGGGGFFWIVLSCIYPSLVYLGTEIVYGIKIAKTSSRENFSVPPRDITYENSVYKVAAIVGIVIYFIMTLMIMLLN